MLTPRENFEEMRKGGKPERFVKQYEAFAMVFTPCFTNMGGAMKPGDINKKNAWGVTISWEEGQPGAFPIHNENTIVIKDMEEWQE